MTPPECFIEEHFPMEIKWQLLDNPITLDEFKQLPKHFHHICPDRGGISPGD